MTTNLFDDGDLQRLTREEELTQQAPRVLPEDDRSPQEDLSILAAAGEEKPKFNFAEMLDGILAALKERL